MIRKIAWQEFLLGHDIAEFLCILIEAGLVWRSSAHDGGAGGIAGRCGTIGVAEQHTAFSKTIEVRGESLRISAHAADPVIEIIQGYKKDVGFLGGERGTESEEQRAESDEWMKGATGVTRSGFKEEFHEPEIIAYWVNAKLSIPQVALLRACCGLRRCSVLVRQ